MERETIDRLFLELSQFTTATTAKELELMRVNDLLRAALIPFAAAASRPARMEGPDGAEIDDDVVLGIGVKAKHWRRAMALTTA